MLSNLAYLAASLIAIVVIVRIAPSTAAAMALCLLLIAQMAVLATLTGSPTDLVHVINAITELIRGRQPP